MKISPSVLIVFLLMVMTLSDGCSSEQPMSPLEKPTSVPFASPVSALSPSSALFIETEDVGVVNSEPSISRPRFVKVNISLLIDDTGQARNLGANSEITLNLFPDVTYTGVVEKIEQNGDGYSWVGHLKGVEFSELTMVFTGGVFIAHIASPGSVYEVSNAGDDLYQVIMIDQTKLPQGG